MKEEKENPLTPEDVCREIDKCRSKGEVPNFSNKEFEEGIDLRGFDLRKVIFRDARFPTTFKRGVEKGANLKGIHLEKADLTGAHLEKADLHETHLEGAVLRDTHLEGAILWDTHLKKANLMRTHLQGANLMRTKFSSDVNLEDVDWGNYILDEEKPGSFDSAVASYRHLKVWYTNAGISDTAAKFYYREKEANRKALKWRSKHFCDRLALEILRVLFGYGERWRRVLISIAVLILLFSLTYCAIGSVWEWSAFGNSLYFSAVSFTALGYGSWVQVTNGWIKGIGAFESLVGISMMALLLVTFFRKWTR